MKKIIALGGSSSKNSINKTLALYAASKVADASITVLDLNDYELPLYSVDREEAFGIPEAAHQFNNLIVSADGLVISLAEHNGSYTAVFKNLIDWLSRIDVKVWKDLPMLLLATSPGEQGAKSVLAAAKTGFPYMGANIIVDFSLPSFYENFSNSVITNSELSSVLQEKIDLFQHALVQLSAV